MYAWYVNTLGELLSFDFISYYMVHKSMNETFMQLEWSFSVDELNVYTPDKMLLELKKAIQFLNPPVPPKKF